jgi:hypothetical protein
MGIELYISREGMANDHVESKQIFKHIGCFYAGFHTKSRELVF